MYQNQRKINKKLKEDYKNLKSDFDELLEKFKQQGYLIEKLLLKIDKLEKNSSNSSKNPSSDIVKKNKSLR
jgi:uncharacterized membrane-anchored protein YhcB (DUF1043 family)